MNDENIYIKKAMHCIRLDRKKPYTRHGRKFYRPWRNCYATSGHDSEWTLMMAAGYAKCREGNLYGGHVFWMTRNGLDWLGEKLGIYIYDEED